MIDKRFFLPRFVMSDNGTVHYLIRDDTLLCGIKVNSFDGWSFPRDLLNYNDVPRMCKNCIRSAEKQTFLEVLDKCWIIKPKPYGW